jgi:hypothetical protein
MQEHLSNPEMHQLDNTSKCIFNGGERRSPLIFKFENVLNVCKAGRAEAMPSSML